MWKSSQWMLLTDVMRHFFNALDHHCWHHLFCYYCCVTILDVTCFVVAVAAAAVIFKRVSLYSSGCYGACCVNWTGFKVRSSSLCFPTAGIKFLCHQVWLIIFLLMVFFHSHLVKYSLYIWMSAYFLFGHFFRHSYYFASCRLSGHFLVFQCFKVEMAKGWSVLTAFPGPSSGS